MGPLGADRGRSPVTFLTTKVFDVAANPRTGDYFITTKDATEDRIVRYNPDAPAEPTSWAVSSKVGFLDVGPDNLIYTVSPDGFEILGYQANGYLNKTLYTITYGENPATATAAGLAIDNGIAWVSDSQRKEIRGFPVEGGQLVGSIANSGPGAVEDPGQLDVDGNGQIYVLDHGDDTVKIYKTDGTFLEEVDLGVSDALDVSADVNGNFWVLRADGTVLVFARAPRVIAGDSFDFGASYLGNPGSPRTIYLQNTNYLLPVPVGASSLADGSQFSVLPGNTDCDGRLLPAKDVCGVSVRFDPDSA